MILNRV